MPNSKTARCLVCAATAIFLAISSASGIPQPARPNVLHIVVDDLRPELPIYGQHNVRAPNLDKLAERAVTFDRAYCQIPVCAPSRNSFLSGREPAATRSWNFLNDFRDGPAGDGTGTNGTGSSGRRWTSLPGAFKKAGYLTLGTGKLFHEKLPPNGDGAHSWSNGTAPDPPQAAAVQFSCVAGGAEGGRTGACDAQSAQDYGRCGYCDPNMVQCPKAKGGTNGTRWCVAEDAPNATYFEDIATQTDAVHKLRFAAANRHATGQPFFLGIGLRKPHMDWRVPRSVLRLYEASGATAEDRVNGSYRYNVSVAAHRAPPAGMPAVAYHDWARSDTEHSLWRSWGFGRDPWAGSPGNDTAREMRAHYYAATTFMDSILGELLHELDALNLTSSTIVCFHSDHGWSLGESNFWRKFSLTELGVRVPLLVAVPWLPSGHGRRAAALVELVDIMPTLLQLAGVEFKPAEGEPPLAGISAVPALTRNVVQPRNSSLSVYPRCPPDPNRLWYSNWCIQVEREQFGYMGVSVRVDGWRYTVFVPWDGDALLPKLPPLRPTNGTAGFVEQLYAHPEDARSFEAAAAAAPALVPAADFDALEVQEVSTQYAQVCDRLYAEILRRYPLQA